MIMSTHTRDLNEIYWVIETCRSALLTIKADAKPNSYEYQRSMSDLAQCDLARAAYDRISDALRYK